MKRARRAGQSIAEYAVGLAVVVLAVSAMSIYVKRALQGRYHDTVNRAALEANTSRQYEPYSQDSTANVSSTADRKTEIYLGGSHSADIHEVTNVGMVRRDVFTIGDDGDSGDGGGGGGGESGPPYSVPVGVGLEDKGISGVTAVLNADGSQTVTIKFTDTSRAAVSYNLPSYKGTIGNVQVINSSMGPICQYTVTAADGVTHNHTVTLGGL